MPTYKQLTQYNPDLDLDQLKKMQLLYAGYPTIIQNASLFMPQSPGERPEAYSGRLACASYYNHFAQIVNDYASSAFSKSLNVVAATDAANPNTIGDDIDQSTNNKIYQQFALDADLCDNPFSEVLRKSFSKSLTTQYTFIGVDFPQENTSENLLEEEETNRPYLYEIPVESVIDWECDEFGNLIFLVIMTESTQRKSIKESRDQKTIQIKVWQRQIDDSGEKQVTYSLYQFKCKINQRPKDSDMAQVIVEDQEVSFKEIPVVCFKVPDNLYIGAMIGGLCINHFSRVTSLLFAENRNLHAVPFYQRGPDIPAVNGPINTSGKKTGAAQVNQQLVSSGAIVGSSEDNFKFVEPDGKCYELINQQNKELVESIHQIVNQMANNILASQTVKSGTSRMIDCQSKEIVLMAYARLIKKFAVKIYRLISEARGEDIVWQAVGMDSYRQTDRQIMLEEIKFNDLYRKAVPSVTSWKANAQRLANQMDDGLEPSVKKQIADEIDQYFDSKNVDEEVNSINGSEPDGDLDQSLDKEEV